MCSSARLAAAALCVGSCTRLKERLGLAVYVGLGDRDLDPARRQQGLSDSSRSEQQDIRDVAGSKSYPPLSLPHIHLCLLNLAEKEEGARGEVGARIR